MPTPAAAVVSLLPPPMLTLDEVSAHFKLSKGAIREAVRDGRLPAVRVGRAYRFDPGALAEFKRAGGKPLARGWARAPEEVEARRAAKAARKAKAGRSA